MAPVTITLVEFVREAARYQKMRVKKRAGYGSSPLQLWLDVWRIEMACFTLARQKRVSPNIYRHRPEETVRCHRFKLGKILISRSRIPSSPISLPSKDHGVSSNSRDLFRDKYSGRSARLKSAGALFSHSRDGLFPWSFFCFVFDAGLGPAATEQIATKFFTP